MSATDNETNPNPTEAPESGLQPDVESVGKYNDTYLESYFDNFKFLDPECHDTRVREINMRTKRCNRCLGFDECKMHPHFWLFGEPVRIDTNEALTHEPAAAKSHVAPYQKIVTRERYDIPEAEAPV